MMCMITCRCQKASSIVCMNAACAAGIIDVVSMQNCYRTDSYVVKCASMCTDQCSLFKNAAGTVGV
jgi:hypothetical protein